MNYYCTVAGTKTGSICIHWLKYGIIRARDHDWNHTSEPEREVTSKKIRVTDKTNVEALRKRFVGGEDLFGTGGEIK